mgnify:CR=1 FL=1
MEQLSTTTTTTRFQLLNISRYFNKLPRLPFIIWLCSTFLLIVAIVTLFGPLLMPYSYEQIDLLARLAPPVLLEGANPEHLLGTDKLGRDTLSRLIVATRTSAALALLGTIFGAILGIVLGFVAAHHRGATDEVISTLIDFQAAMPYFIIALAILAFMGNSMVVFLTLMGLYGWEKYARITRGLVLSAKEHGYALAQKALGAPPGRTYLRHIFPNILSPLIVQMTINLPETILFETSLSFLGLGIRPPMTSLGQMIGEGRDYLVSAWWLAVVPGSVIFLTTISVSIVGDAIRSRLDPALQD